MIYCVKHCLWHSCKCPKCLAGEPAYLRTREEVADPNDWLAFQRKGWTR
jgi:hypothetical protein